MIGMQKSGKMPDGIFLASLRVIRVERSEVKKEAIKLVRHLAWIDFFPAAPLVCLSCP